MRLGAVAIVAWMPVVVAQQESDAKTRPVVVSIQHLVDPGDTSAAPRLLPFEDAPPIGALRPAAPAKVESLLHVVGNVSRIRFELDEPVSVECDGDQLVVDADAVDRGRLRAFVRDCIEAFAPAVVLEVGVYGPGPGPAPAVLAPDEVERFLAGAPRCSSSVRRAAGHIVSIEVRGAAGDRLRLRVEPHLLETSHSIALLFEFELDRRGRDGKRCWTAGTASGVVESGGALALTLPDRVVVLRARHEVRATKPLVGFAWSLSSTESLWHKPELAVGPSGLRFALPTSPLVQLSGMTARRPFDPDVLQAQVQRSVHPRWWDEGDGIEGEGLRRRLLVVGSNERLEKALPAIRDVLAGFEKPLSETAQVDCLLPAGPQPAVPAWIRLPTLPGRAVCVLHAAWQPDGVRAGLVAFRWIEDGGGSAVSGFGVGLRGDHLAEVDGEPLLLRAGPLGRTGKTELTESAELRVEISRAP